MRRYADEPAASFIDNTSQPYRRGPLTYLALSGGGADGAYGAGVLNGWTASGTRPTFLIVSGVSTGALIAPFAFLGPQYDETLPDIYTSGVAASLIDTPNVLNALFGGAFQAIADCANWSRSMSIRKCLSRSLRNTPREGNYSLSRPTSTPSAP
ncbi:MAG: patatin-like phospholipase family protein [Afipia sp.]|nr:patatin-like phospholipase family protein [Afipia sp.]